MRRAKTSQHSTKNATSVGMDTLSPLSLKRGNKSSYHGLEAAKAKSSINDIRVIATGELEDKKHKIYSRKRNAKVSKMGVALSEADKLTDNIVADVKSLADVEEIRDQICICAKIKQQTLRLLKMTKTKTEENYQKGCIHLFFQAIARNYAQHIFKEPQLDLLVEIMEESKKGYVSEERYFQLDKKVYDNRLSIFPEEE